MKQLYLLFKYLWNAYISAVSDMQLACSNLNLQWYNAWHFATLYLLIDYIWSDIPCAFRNVCGWSCCSAVQTTPWYIFVIWNNKVIEREFALHMHCILINIWPESKSLQWNNLRTNKPRLTIMQFCVLHISWWTTDRIHILWWQQWRVTKRQIYLRGTCD